MAKPAGLAGEKIIRPAAKAADRLPVQVTLSTLAKLLGIGLTGARELAERKILIAGLPGQFILEHSVSSYCAHLRKLAQGMGGEAAIGEATRARARLMSRQAELTEAKAGRLAGTLIDADDVETFWAGKLKALRTRVLAAADGIAYLTKRDQKALDAGLRSALDDLANSD